MSSKMWGSSQPWLASINSISRPGSRPSRQESSMRQRKRRLPLMMVAKAPRCSEPRMTWSCCLTWPQPPPKSSPFPPLWPLVHPTQPSLTARTQVKSVASSRDHIFVAAGPRPQGIDSFLSYDPPAFPNMPPPVHSVPARPTLPPSFRVNTRTLEAFLPFLPK